MFEMNKKLFINLLIISSISLVFFLTAFVNIYTFARATGDSMLPTIPPGSTIMIQKSFLPSNLTGYIVGYYNSEWRMRVDHRAIADNGTFFLPKGDNPQSVPDGWWPKSSVIGIIVKWW